MNILLLGVGLQGRAALYDLVRSSDVQHVRAADANLPALQEWIERLRSLSLPVEKVEAAPIDAQDEAALRRLMDGMDAAVALLPNSFTDAVARLAVENGLHFINSSYPSPGLPALSQAAANKDLAILPEFGFDPGIDLVLAGQAIRELDEVDVFNSYGTGFPEPAAVDNPLSYKISWSFAGVLKAYTRDARLIRDGQEVRVPGRQIFAPENVHTLDLGEWGMMEAYPNGDVIPYLERLGIRSEVRQAGRYSSRYPGHAQFWYVLSQMGFLEDRPMPIDGGSIAPREFVCRVLEPQLQYGPDERDVALLRVDVAGMKGGQPCRIVYQVTDLRDLKTGLMAMNRTVGYTAAIGAQMILSGEIPGRGLLSPLTDVPYGRFVKHLEERQIHVERIET